MVAERCKHAWVNKLDLSRWFGKKAHAQGGRFDSKYTHHGAGGRT